MEDAEVESRAEELHADTVGGRDTVVVAEDASDEVLAAEDVLEHERRRKRYVDGVVMPYFYLLWDYRYYRWIWFSNIISRLGDWVNYLACLEILNQYSSSGMLLSMYLITRSLPVFLMGPIAGVVADSFDRRHVMIFSDMTRMITVLAFLLVRSYSTLWILYVASVMQFVFGALFEPARSALVPHAIDDYALVTANAFSSTTWSVMAFLGSSAGGLVTGLFGPKGSYLIDSATYLLSAICVARLLSMVIPVAGEIAGKESVKEGDSEVAVDIEMKNVAEREKKMAEDALETLDVAVALPKWKRLLRSSRNGLKEGWSSMLKGFRFLQHNRYILALCFLKFSSQTVVSAMNEANIVFCQEVFVYGLQGSTSLGILYCVIGAGTAVFPMVGKKLTQERTEPTHVLIVCAFASASIFAILLAWSPNFIVFLIANFLRSGTSAIVWTFSTVLIQVHSLDMYMGRTFSFDYGLSTIAQVGGILWAGFAFDRLEWSPHRVALAGSVGYAFMFTVWALYFTFGKPDLNIVPLPEDMLQSDGVALLADEQRAEPEDAFDSSDAIAVD